VALCLTPCALRSAAPQQAPPAHGLFGTDEPLQLTLRADFKALAKDRGTDHRTHDGVLTYFNAGADSGTLSVTLRTRGHFRLKSTICDFPPIKVDFNRQQATATVFRHTGSLKLATHCVDRPSYEHYLLEEYLIYRVYNLLTDLSFRVRLAHVTYADTASKREPLTRYAFFIEDDDRMARRNHAQVLAQKGITQAETDIDQTGLLTVFEYMIANTDWSVAGLHNIVLVRDSIGTIFPVSYDFDWSGVISPPYARPDPILGLTTVRQRLFRGYCRTPEQFAEIFARFNGRKDAIYALYRNQAGMEPKRVEQALRYYDDFFRTINDPGLVRREFLRTCQR